MVIPSRCTHCKSPISTIYLKYMKLTYGDPSFDFENFGPALDKVGANSNCCRSTLMGHVPDRHLLKMLGYVKRK